MAKPSNEALYFTLFIGVALMALCGACTWTVMQDHDPYSYSTLAPFVGGVPILIGAVMSVTAIIRLIRRRR